MYINSRNICKIESKNFEENPEIIPKAKAIKKDRNRIDNIINSNTNVYSSSDFREKEIAIKIEKPVKRNCCTDGNLECLIF